MVASAPAPAPASASASAAQAPGPLLTDLSARVWAAHADTWQVQGRLRAAVGGGAVRLPGARLMASGIDQAQWNGGDVDDLARLSLADVAAWYAARADGRGVPWGLRVPEGVRIPGCTLIKRQRCMALTPPRFTEGPPPSGRAPAVVTIEPATPDDLDAVVQVDAAAFGGDPVPLRRWLAPQLGAPRITVVLARLRGKPVGTATAVHTDEEGGPAAGLFGIGVVAHVRNHGIGSALTAWLVRDAFARGATLIHLNPDTDVATRLYARLGFIETAGIDIHAGWTRS